MRRALEKSGATPPMAAATAAALVAAELDGIPSHGASRIPQYCGHVKNGRATGSAVPEGGARAGRRVPGGRRRRARVRGLRARGARGDRARAPARRGLRLGDQQQPLRRGRLPRRADRPRRGSSGSPSATRPAAMPMWGGKRALFGTNPIAAAFPRRDAPPLVIDLSLSEVARGKLMVAAREGKPIPAGWALDKDGNPTTDPKAGLEGMMLPAGGAKGAMLALTVELLVCALSGRRVRLRVGQLLRRGGQAHAHRAGLPRDRPGGARGARGVPRTRGDAGRRDARRRRRAPARRPAARQPRAHREGRHRASPRTSRRRSAPWRARAEVAPFQACVRTPFGTVGISATDQHVTGIRYLSPEVPALAPPMNTVAYLACVQLQFYLDDPAFAFDLPLQARGHAPPARGLGGDARRFPRARRAPTASSRRSIGSSARAVGGACGANPIPIVVPCHRVVGAGRVPGRVHGRARGGLRALHQALAARP